MKRDEQHAANRRAIERARRIPVQPGEFPPSSWAIAGVLSQEGYVTSREKPWTGRTFLKMLRREGYSGTSALFGIPLPMHDSPEKGHAPTAGKGHAKSMRSLDALKRQLARLDENLRALTGKKGHANQGPGQPL